MTDWLALRRVTQARIALPRAGASLSTPALLEFQAAHAAARDAVWRSWDIEACEAQLAAAELPTLRVASSAADRASYLARPDLGRSLRPADRTRLATEAEVASAQDVPDVALILSDGLSATAVHEHGVRTISAIWRELTAANLRCSKIVLAAFGRVALSDDIGQALGSRCAVIALGERPGLSAADSLGLYLTFRPALGNTDAQRNCISNVREPNGLSPQLAAKRLASLVRRSLTLSLSGVALKDDAPELP